MRSFLIPLLFASPLLAAEPKPCRIRSPLRTVAEDRAAGYSARTGRQVRIGGAT